MLTSPDGRAPRARALRTERWRAEWLTDPRTNLVAGLVVALALIPEAISFSIIAGVDPRVGLYASFVIAIVIAFAGGRPGMISAATGAMALVVVPLVAEHGVEYLLAAGILAGVIQITLGALGIGRVMRLIPRGVMVGFVNALAILIFLAQVPHLLLTDDGADRSQLPLNLAFVGAGLVVIYGLPRLTRAVPSPLVAIVALSGIAIGFGLDLPTVGDMGALPDALPLPSLPSVPAELGTIGIILPFAITLALVGLLESLLTARLLDEKTDTPSDKNTEARGQGIANIASGLLGGMAGCAMIGQSMINHATGGRSRLSTLASGVFLLILVMVLGGVVADIPMAALVAVMIMVSVGTFEWRSIVPSTLRSVPRAETAVMVVTVAIVVATHNLALGVAAGVIVSAVTFVAQVSTVVQVTSVTDPDNTEELYAVVGDLFFASTADLVSRFEYDRITADTVEIDLSEARVWDTSAVAALDAVVARFAARGIRAQLVGLNRHAAALHEVTTGKVSAGH